jgi:hypothetical protein
MKNGRNRFTLLLAALVSAALLWGCGSSGSGGSDVAAGTDLAANVQTLGITNCAICHSDNTPVTADWLASRHAAGTFGGTNATCLACHDSLGDGQLMQQAFGLVNRNVVGCESCHGGGSAHRGIGPLPFPVPGPAQCGQCHGLEAALIGRHANNPDEMIHDTHFDNPATTGAPTNTPIEGYVVKTADQRGCQACHYNAHQVGPEALVVNRQWARSAHGGFILDVKDAAFAISVADGLAAAVTDDAAPGWSHYNWDQTTGTGNRASCQRCHTTTGAMNFMNDSVGYSPAINDFSHLAGWTAATGSPQNEMLYCWGCHIDNSASLRASGTITLDFEFLVGDDQDPSGVRSFVVLPNKGNSNVCAACHSGRGNDTSIRDSYAAAALGNQALSNRFAGHHAPTAGSLYAAVTHTGFEFATQDYTTPELRHDIIGGTASGPCASCHMGGSEPANHLFMAVTEDDLGAIATITNQPLCNSCHDVGALAPVNPAALNQLRVDFDAARQILLDLVTNTIPNRLNLDISATANRTTNTLALNDFGAYQNSLYMTEEPCIRVHNSLYGKRLVFDSIDWLEDGELNGTIANTANWLGDGTARP